MGQARNPVNVILLSIVTLGVYVLVWFYKANRELLEVSQVRMNVGLLTFLLVVPGVGLWSLYVMAKNVAVALSRRGLASKSPFALFLWLAVPILNLVGIPKVQAEINRVWKK